MTPISHNKTTNLPLSNNSLSCTSFIEQGVSSVSLIQQQQPPPLPPRRTSVVAPKLPLAVPSIELDNQCDKDIQVQLQQSSSLSPKRFFLMILICIW